MHVFKGHINLCEAWYTGKLQHDTHHQDSSIGRSLLMSRPTKCPRHPSEVQQGGEGTPRVSVQGWSLPRVLLQSRIQVEGQERRYVPLFGQLLNILILDNIPITS